MISDFAGKYKIPSNISVDPYPFDARERYDYSKGDIHKVLYSE